MASAVSISDNELQEIKRNHPQKHGQALQIIYKWQEKNPNTSIEELQMFLFSVGEPHAANRFVNGNLRYYRAGESKWSAWPIFCFMCVGHEHKLHVLVMCKRPSRDFFRNLPKAGKYSMDIMLCRSVRGHGPPGKFRFWTSKRGNMAQSGSKFILVCVWHHVG